MSDMHDCDNTLYIIDHIDDTVVTNPYAPGIASDKLQATNRPWVRSKSTNGISDTRIDLARKLTQLFLSAPSNEHRVICHSRAFSIS